MTIPKVKDLDSMILGPESADGSRPCIRKQSDGTFSCGRLEPLQDGRPIDAPVVTLTHRGPGELYDVEDVYTPPTSGGPPKVNSRAFQTGWDKVYGKKTKTSNLAN